MKQLLLSALVLISLTISAQKQATVKLKIMYNSSPLCNWEVTLKHGDVAIGKSTSDENGIVEFKNVTILSKSVDAYGYKTHKNVEKKWDVKGYIQLNDDFYSEVDFTKIIKETGMPVSMIENAWGLTINDCGQVSQPSSNTTTPTKTEEVTSPATSSTSTEEAEEEPSKLTTMSPLENLEQQKMGYQNRISNYERKIEKKEMERSKVKPTSTEYSTLSYEIRDLELDMEINKIKLERTEVLISKGGNAPLSKEQRQGFDAREDVFVTEQKELKQKQKSGVFYGKTATTAATTETVKPASKDEIATVEEEGKKMIYTPNEISEMSTVGLKKLKLDNNSGITKRKVTLKTKSAFLKPTEKADLQLEIDDLTKQVELIEEELLKRSETD